METAVQNLGAARFPSPLRYFGESEVAFRKDSERVIYDHSLAAWQNTVASGQPPVSFEVAGPREELFFNPAKVTAGIVTCGGLCPGVNDIIRGLVMQMFRRYGASKIYGFRYGYEGLIPHYGHTPVVLKPDSVAHIHKFGGTILGTSRGPQDIGEMVDLLEEMQVDVLFVIGGDGTLRGASAIAAEIERRGFRKSVIGIPKTIDNDIMYLDKSFGFETAFAEAVQSVNSAHTESLGSVNGIGLVKLMGRDSGFIASYATLAGNDVNYVLIPEVHFELEGQRGLLESLRYRLAKRKHAVIVVAEGAGQHLIQTSGNTDASGNKKLGDIGLFLKDQISLFFKERRIEINLKYIDPSYNIRSVPARPQDNVFCSQLAQHAVHAAMAGKTNMLVGRWHGNFVNLPLKLITAGRHRVNLEGDLWHSVLECTGQPSRMF